MKFRRVLILSLILAVTLSFANNKEDAFDNLLFHLNLNKKGERSAIEAAVMQYNKNSASFYNTGGFLAGLDEIPAAPLLKRRLFKDINMLKGDGLVMVFDKDSITVRKVYFKNKDFGVAETDEVWAVALQDIKTRKPVFNVKAVEVKGRYVFIKEKSRWLAYEADVYPKGENVPEFNIKPAL